MFYIQFKNVLCYYINLIDSKYSISPLKAFVHRVATIHKNPNWPKWLDDAFVKMPLKSIDQFYE